MTKRKCSLGWEGIPIGKLSSHFNFAKGHFKHAQPKDCDGEGIIIAGGGKYERYALAVARHARGHNLTIPIEVWALNTAEIKNPAAFRQLGVDLKFCDLYFDKMPMRRFSGWHSKVFAVMNSRLQNVLFLDADCFPSREGLALLRHPHFQQFGALFFQDVKRCAVVDDAYVAAGLLPPHKMRPPVQEWETGQFLVDKKRHWGALLLANWAAEHDDSWWRLLHGDKGTTEIAFRAMGAPYTLGSASWDGWGIQHSYNGIPCFRHCVAAKRGEAPMPDDLVRFFAP
jgi:hypothetical protein